MKFKIVLILLLVLGCGKRSYDEDLMISNRLGTEIIEVALEKHGEFLEDSSLLSVQISCHDYYHPTQSQKPFHPMSAGFFERSILSDPEINEVIFESKMKAGNYLFHDIIIQQNGKGVSYNVNTRTFEKNNFNYLENLDILPQTYLRRALANKAAISIEEDMDSKFTIVGFFNGSQHRFWLGEDTTLIKIEHLKHSSIYGQGLRTIIFENIKPMDGYQIPTKVIDRYSNGVWGVVENIHWISDVSEEIQLDLKSKTADFIEADHSDRGTFEVKNLTDRIYILENVTSSKKFWSYNILFVEFDDFLMVAEAPVSDDISEQVVKKIKELFPEKPIRYLVQTHHHSDHIAGIKKYLEDSVTIISTPSTLDVVDKIISAYRYDEMINQKPEYKKVNEKLMLSDSSMKLVILDIGPTLHSEEMIVIYFPQSKILYQADMLNAGEWPMDTKVSQEFLEKIKELDLQVEMIVGLHGKVVFKNEVHSLLK